MAKNSLMHVVDWSKFEPTLGFITDIDAEVVELEVWLVLKNTGEMKVLKSRSRSSTNNRRS